jgi:hypothetical protein
MGLLNSIIWQIELNKIARIVVLKETSELEAQNSQDSPKVFGMLHFQDEKRVKIVFKLNESPFY